MNDTTQATTLNYRAAMLRRLQRRTEASGKLVMPAVPGLLEDYVEIFCGLFLQLGVNFSAQERDQFRNALEGELAIAFVASPRSEIVVTYDSPTGLAVNYHVKARWQSLSARYESWLATRKPPLFGTEPDAKVWKLALTAEDPSLVPVLDVGAGTGRNAIALCRRGHPVDAVELTPRFAQMLRDDAQAESLPVRVFETDVFTNPADLRSDYGLMVLSEVVSDFRSAQQLRQLFELATHRLSVGGCLVFNVFLVKDGFSLDEAAFELAQQCYCAFFMRQDLAKASEGLPLRLTSDESVHAYEKAHLPAGAWPPTGWYEGWVNGLDVFDVSREQSPIGMRWLTYRKQA
jgi:SAM-dependent methyltransferase